MLPPSDYLLEQLFVGRDNFQENLKMQGNVVFLAGIWRSVDTDVDRSFHVAFAEPKSTRAVQGPEHTCSV